MKSMNSKSYIALLLLALVSVKTLLVPVVYLDFEMRKDFITQNLCEITFHAPTIYIVLVVNLLLINNNVD